MMLFQANRECLAAHRFRRHQCMGPANPAQLLRVVTGSIRYVGNRQTGEKECLNFVTVKDGRLRPDG